MIRDTGKRKDIFKLSGNGLRPSAELACASPRTGTIGALNCLQEQVSLSEFCVDDNRYNPVLYPSFAEAMKKKSSRTKAIQHAAPQPAQLHAVRKLLYYGQYTEAKTRVAELRTRYPDFKPLLALAWEVDDAAGNSLSASLHAWDWSTASPGSRAALEALRDSAFDAQLSALGTLAAQKLARIEGHSEPELPSLPSALGDLTFQQGVTADLSRLFLAYGRFGEAIAALDSTDHPATRNNRALAHFAQGDIAAALTDFDANWQQDSRNLFALLHVVQLRLWTNGRAAALQLAAALRDTEPLRREDAYGKMFGLLLLGAFDDMLDAWKTLREAQFWHSGNAVYQSICTYFVGLAALRKGDMETARQHFSKAVELAPDNMDAADASMAFALRQFGHEHDLKAGEFHDWFPQSWIIKFQSATGARAQNAVFEEQIRSCNAHADYLGIAAELGGKAVRHYAISVLKSRALHHGDKAARDQLHLLLTRPCGPDQVRLDLNIWLQENGLADVGKPQPLLVRGEVQELALRPMRLHTEQTLLGLPPESQARLEQVHGLLAKHDLQGALRIAEELDAAHPDRPTLIGNIASIKEGLRDNQDEIEMLYQRAAELDPTYLFAQAGLARIAARKGDVARAKELLRLLQGREEYHVSEWRALLAIERQIALAQHDMAAVFRVDDALDDLNKQFG